jgi:hypothetical protein
MRTVTPLLKVNASNYFALPISIRSCHMELSTGEIQQTAKRVFIIQNKIIRIMAGVKRISCRELFKKFNILPLASELLLSRLSFAVDNLEMFR